MSTIDVKVIGTANVTQMTGAFAQVQGSVAATNAELAKMIALSQGVDARGMQRMTRAAKEHSNVYRSALASTGMFEVQQMKVNRATDDYVKKLKAQKLSFRDMIRDRKIAAAAYREQLAMENMLVKSSPVSTAGGRRHILDVSYAKEVSAELNTAGRRMAWFNEQLKSGAHQMVNWGKNTQWAGRQLMVGLTIPMAAFGAAAGVMAFQVDKELTRIAKVYDTTHDAMSKDINEVMAAERELLELREMSTQSALKAAKEYGAAATDTLQVQAELAATGLSGAQLQEYTNEVMRISTLGELEHQDAIKTTIALQSTFKLSTQELTEAFDYMNAVENSTSLQTADFAKAIPIAAGPMKAWGGDIRELGVLLTAMRENGIGAAEGANAVKATLQRLARPSKQIRGEWEALTNTDITKIVADADSLTDVFKQINEVTKNLSENDQRKAFAGLFGSYQVSRMMAMTKGMEDLSNGVGQVSSAAQLATADADELANVAAGELAAQAESVSGQWTRAVEEMKIQLSTMGEPFLVAATTVVKGISWLIDKFNELPGPVKTTLAILLGLAAAAGPLIMLVGLMGNLAGNALKGAAMLTNLAVKMNILDAESRAANAAQELINAGFVDGASATQMLTAELEKHNKSLMEANRLMNESVGAAKASAAARAEASGIGVTPVRRFPPSGRRELEPNEQFIGNGRIGGRSGGISTYDYHGTTQIDYARTNANNKLAQAERDRMHMAVKSRLAAEGETVAKQKTLKTSQALALSTAAISAGVLLTSTNSNKFANFLGDALITASMAVMAAKAMADAYKAAAASALLLSARTKAAAGWAILTGGGIGGIVKGLGKAAKWLWRMIPGWGKVVGLVATGGVALWKWMNRTKAAREEQEKLRRAVAGSADAWAKGANKAKKSWGGLSSEIGKATEKSRLYGLIQDYDSDENAGIMKGYKNEDLSEDDRVAYLRKHFLDLQVQYGVGVKAAEDHVRAIMILSGDGLAEQNRIIEEISGNYGKFTQADFTRYLSDAIDRMNDLEIGTTEFKNAGKEVADTFITAFNDNMSPQQANVLMKRVGTAAMSGYNEAVEIASQNGEMADRFKEMGINSGRALEEALREHGSIGEFWDEFLEGVDPTLSSVALEKELYDMLGVAQETEESIISKITGAKTGVGALVDDSIVKLHEFENQWQVTFRGLSLTGVQNELKEMASDLSSMPSLLGGVGSAIDDIATYGMKGPEKMRYQLGKMSEEQSAAFNTAVATAAMLHDIEPGNDSVETYFNILKGIKKETDNIASATQMWGNRMTMTSAKITQVQREGMTGVQQDIADGFSRNFDNAMSSAIEARQEYWDNQQEKLARQMDKRAEALDVKWERKKDAAEQYWSRREEAVESAIEAEQKAEDKRKKMFDAEIARINKLNDMANTNIDFNVALNSGDLDEAARIRNNVTAAEAQSILERAAERGGARSDRRVEKLGSQKDLLDQARDEHMEALDDREEAERKHLEKVRKRREASLKREVDADMKAQRNIWDNRKRSLDDQLRLFTAYVARNEKDLKKHMNNVGLSYSEFGDKSLKPTGEDWSSHFGERLNYHVRAAGMKIRSDNMWEKVGKQGARGILEGMGFTSWRQFNVFLKTGEMTDDPVKKKSPNGKRKPTGQTPGGIGVYTAHEGGMLGSNKNSRKGVARTQRGLHPSEVMVRAQKGEFMVNRDAASKNSDILHRINSGEAVGDSGMKHGGSPYRGRPVGGSGEPPGIMGMMTGVMTRLFMNGIKNKMQNSVAAAETKFAPSGMGFSAGKSGMFSDREFSTEQLKNAAIIANVGSSMGMSRRDIMIGIMTAITESGLVNVNYGDRDSLGLFQQRPSMGWGTPEQVTNPEYAAGKFFSELKKVNNRDDLSPWMAAQTVQRSYDPKGLNFKQYWDNAQAIYKAGLVKNRNGDYESTGPGGWHRPVPRGYSFGGSTHDISVPVGTKVMAVGDGKIVESRYITSGGSLKYQGSPVLAPNGMPYRSYGEMIKLQTSSGTMTYAHLMPGSRLPVGRKVKGGDQIARSGNTGNSSGPHLHMDIGGQHIAPSWLAARGIHLKKGAANVNFDNTLANLHKGEAVLTEDINKKFRQGVDNFASGGGNTYNVSVSIDGAGADVNELATKVVKVIKREESRKPRPRRNT